MDTEITIITGGQTGCDRAVADFAMKNKIPYQGYIPRGRLAEDGKIPLCYENFKEGDSAEYSERTYRNVLMAEAVLILYKNKMDKGTRLTAQLARIAKKPLLMVDTAESISLDAISDFLSNYSRVNIAGPRESNSPGIYAKVYEVLEKCLSA